MMKSMNFFGRMIIIFLLVGCVGDITKYIELPESKKSSIQEPSSQITQKSRTILSLSEELKTKVTGVFLSYEEHTPLVIYSNTQFNTTASAEGWPGNGTISNPFIIEGLNITGPSGTSLINIQNTNVYFQIYNCLLASGSYGFFLSGVTNGIISNNTMISNTCGIWIESSENNTILNNTFSENIYGVQLFFSANNNSFVNNSFSSSSTLGVNSIGSGNNLFINNSFSECGLYFTGGLPSDYLQIKVVGNSVNGKPLIYWQNVNGGTIPIGAGQIILVNCQSITITGQNLSDTAVGFQAAYSTNLTIFANIAIHNKYGFLLHHSSENNLDSNIALNNTRGMGLYYSSNNVLINNTVSTNTYGIHLEEESNENTLINNFVSHNTHTGIYLGQFTSFNTLSGNTASNNSYHGIRVHISNKNDIYGNIITNNDDYGILLSAAEDNKILRNDFANNNPSGFQGSDVSGLANTFAYNYWNDWTTPDLNSDGFVDIPFVISGDSNSKDFHPLTNPLHLSPPTVIFPNGGSTLDGMITLQWSPARDQWGHMLTYSVYYSNDSGSIWITLASGLNTTSYLWNTTTVADGTNYLVKVVTNCTGGVSVEDISDSMFSIQNIVPILPESPQNLIITTGELFIYLNWSPPDNDGGSPITGYRLYRGTDSGHYTVIFITSDTNYNDSLVKSDVTYYYVVTAINTVGESYFSDEVNAKSTEPVASTTVTPAVDWLFTTLLLIAISIITIAKKRSMV